mmetsp:Transcript_8406/g.24708  ORF Transcript_8406/g.24708 Transcript_8406/m.24708 type:complete len:154 (+) Transcript_8406:383-844(+)
MTERNVGAVPQLRLERRTTCSQLSVTQQVKTPMSPLATRPSTNTAQLPVNSTGRGPKPGGGSGGANGTRGAGGERGKDETSPHHGHEEHNERFAGSGGLTACDGDSSGDGIGGGVSGGGGGEIFNGIAAIKPLIRPSSCGRKAGSFRLTVAWS